MLRENKKIFICKNDIDKNYAYLANHGFGGFNKAYLKREIDEYIDWNGADRVELTGSDFDPKRQRHTNFIDLNNFYRFVVKG